MDDFEVFLEQESKSWFYRNDGSPLAEFQYNMYLLVQRIESILLSREYYKSLEEKTKRFEEYKDSYFDILYKSLRLFSEIIKDEKVIDERFINAINRNKKSLESDYDSRIQFLDANESKAVNDMIFAYQTLLRAINTYIKNNDFGVNFIEINEPIYFNAEPEEYIQWLQDFTKDQKKLRLDD